MVRTVWSAVRRWIQKVLRPAEAALRRTVIQTFEKLGVTREDTAAAADALIMTDLRGVETHGVSKMLCAVPPSSHAADLEQ